MKIQLLATPICLLFSLVAYAANPSPSAAERGSGDDAELATAPVSTQHVERDCPRPTGSRIVRKERDGCVVGAGRSYDRRDLDSTGARDAGQALQMLDPSIRGRR
jgi:hypothetical protein